MIRVGLLSDTHGYLDPALPELLADRDEIWHAGDFGPGVADALRRLGPLRGVFGNIDGAGIRRELPRDLRFRCDGLDVFMTHIGGYPGAYDRRVAPLLRDDPPALFVAGHSHILKVMRDPDLGNMLHLNPGAAGRHGFHKVRTLLSFTIDGERVRDLEAIELGPRQRESPTSG